MLGLHCWVDFSLVVASESHSPVGVNGLLVAVASLVAEPESRALGLSSCGPPALERRLSGCGTWAWLLCSMWDLPRPGVKPVSPALAGGLSTTEPPGKSLNLLLKKKLHYIVTLQGIHFHWRRRTGWAGCCCRGSVGGGGHCGEKG